MTLTSELISSKAICESKSLIRELSSTEPELDEDFTRIGSDDLGLSKSDTQK
jgi:hypothetical protein